MPIEIVAYRDSWPEEFGSIAADIRRLVGEHVRSIHHIGSTAVPGLAAKDRIDIQLGTDALDWVEQRAAVLTAGDFGLRPDIRMDHRPPGDVRPAAEWSKRYIGAAGTRRACNIHVRIVGHANYRYPLLFRDYLRAHPAAAAAYAALKRQLARYHAEDIDAYVEIKDPACDIIMAAAEIWAAQTAWKLPADDY